MKIYYSGANDSINKLLSPHGDIISENDWSEKAHVLVVDIDKTNNAVKTTIERAQTVMKPILLLTPLGNEETAYKLLNGYPFAAIGEYKTAADRKKIIDVFFSEYGGTAKTMNGYCCGGGCCKQE